MKSKMRGGGSTPSMVPAGCSAHEYLCQDEQGVYHGCYTMGGESKAVSL
jgi:hypothetical protein